MNRPDEPDTWTDSDAEAGVNPPQWLKDEVYGWLESLRYTPGYETQKKTLRLLRNREARISELEAALEPYVTHAHSNAARVLRKGEQP